MTYPIVLILFSPYNSRRASKRLKISFKNVTTCKGVSWLDMLVKPTTVTSKTKYKIKDQKTLTQQRIPRLHRAFFLYSKHPSFFHLLSPNKTQASVKGSAICSGLLLRRSAMSGGNIFINKCSAAFFFRQPSGRPRVRRKYRE